MTSVMGVYEEWFAHLLMKNGALMNSGNFQQNPLFLGRFRIRFFYLNIIKLYTNRISKGKTIVFYPLSNFSQFFLLLFLLQKDPLHISPVFGFSPISLAQNQEENDYRSDNLGTHDVSCILYRIR